MQLIILLALIAILTLTLSASSVPAQSTDNAPAADSLEADAGTVPSEKFWAGKGEMVHATTEVGGIKREYYVYKPVDAGAHSSLPTVLAFHGGGGTARGMDSKCCGGLTAAADRGRFAVVFPQGINHKWNDGRDVNAKPPRDDVQFVAQLIDKLVSSGVADPKRIYATGISNGGFFCQYLALKMPEKFAAIAPVAASLADEQKQLKSSQPVPVAFFLGTKDPIVPWAGGKIGLKNTPMDRGQCLPALQAVQFWRQNNHTRDTGTNERIGDGELSVMKSDYGDPGSRSEVLLYQIEGGGHTWPGGDQYLPAIIVGKVCRDLNANDAIWQFFQAHHL